MKTANAQKKQRLPAEKISVIVQASLLILTLESQFLSQSESHTAKQDFDEGMCDPILGVGSTPRNGAFYIPPSVTNQRPAKVSPGGPTY